MGPWNALPARSGNTLPAQPVPITHAESYRRAPLAELRYSSDLVLPVGRLTPYGSDGSELENHCLRDPDPLHAIYGPGGLMTADMAVELGFRLSW